jgi:voltage-gated potassium channel
MLLAVQAGQVKGIAFFGRWMHHHVGAIGEVEGQGKLRSHGKYVGDGVHKSRSMAASPGGVRFSQHFPIMPQPKNTPWQAKLHEVIYEAHTPAGKAFDVGLLFLILASIIVVMLDSVESLHARWGEAFYLLEWIFTIIFTIEYILRLTCIRRPLLYVISFLGIIDLLAIIPTYLSLVHVGAESLLVVRSLRLLRVFRIFKLTHFLSEMDLLGNALRGSRTKILIFLMVVLTLVITLGSVMYLVEGPANGYTSIPNSIYWAVVTLTTVGYGDISPVTPLGKFIATMMMLIGYGIIAVPTGIVTSEMVRAGNRREQHQQVCTGCGREGHDADARFCKSCGTELE